jgi:hypothetical protein
MSRAMQTLNLYAFIAEAEGRRRELFIDDSPAATDALRNKGERRTPAKREMLRRMDERGRMAGAEPLRSYY